MSGRPYTADSGACNGVKCCIVGGASMCMESSPTLVRTGTNDCLCLGMEVGLQDGLMSHFENGGGSLEELGKFKPDLGGHLLEEKQGFHSPSGLTLGKSDWSLQSCDDLEDGMYSDGPLSTLGDSTTLNTTLGQDFLSLFAPSPVRD
ncbi:unnamed protein product, partial [Choristocarpus tenellus]